MKRSMLRRLFFRRAKVGSTLPSSSSSSSRVNSLYSSFIEAVSQNDLSRARRLARRLDDAGVVLSRIRDQQGLTALHIAAERGDAAMAALLISHCPDFVRIPEPTRGRVPLHVAVEPGRDGSFSSGRRDVTNVLLAFDASLASKRDWRGATPMDIAHPVIRPELAASLQRLRDNIASRILHNSELSIQ